ncbi:MAG: histidine triad nucleotide-binding protein [Eubacteriales bacterium]|nr:histidine triad nucleotide-binding protein [Eubacteriales bacterium]
MDDCIFCRIAAGQIPCDKVYEDEQALAFRDIAPQAPVHMLVVPKAHMRNVAECERDHPELVGCLFSLAARLAAQEGLAKGGFRLVTNCGPDAAQSVDHFHIHILGGGQLRGLMA